MPSKSKEELKNKILNLLNIENKKAMKTSKNESSSYKTTSIKEEIPQEKELNTSKTATNSKVSSSSESTGSTKTDIKKSATSKSKVNKTASKTSASKSNTGKTSSVKTATAKGTAGKTATSKSSTNKTSSVKTATAKGTAGKTATSKSSTNKTSSVKTATAQSSTGKNSVSKKTTTNKSNTKIAKNLSSKKSTNSKSKTKKVVKKDFTTVEYYDLPYRYNETIVKILAQTPNMLFIYWDISDDDRNSYIEKYGENFFNTTKPVLIITNKTMNYSFEVEINDFANSWYLHINDADCDYAVELGRRPVEYNSNIDNYIYITTSNDMQMPNDHILFDRLGKSVFFKNIKNNLIEEKEISSISFIKSLGRAYDIYDLYKEIYNGEINIEDLATGNIKLNLSSSNSSTFK